MNLVNVETFVGSALNGAGSASPRKAPVQSSEPRRAQQHAVPLAQVRFGNGTIPAVQRHIDKTAK